MGLKPAIDGGDTVHQGFTEYVYGCHDCSAEWQKLLWFTATWGYSAPRGERAILPLHSPTLLFTKGLP
jgi:hypothetical protein